jgi:hypothetical protein
MSNAAPENQIEFLKGAWQALVADLPQPFSKTVLAPYVSPAVIERLPEQTTLENVVTECHAQAAFVESYIRSFLSFKKSWSGLTTESRHAIVQQSMKCRLDGRRGVDLKLLADDEAALTIQWDVADRLFATARTVSANMCRDQGLELTQPRSEPRPSRFKDAVARGQEILVDLLRERVNIDKTAITMAVGYVTPVARTKVMNRLTAEYLDALDGFRAGLLHWLHKNIATLSGTSMFAGVISAEQITPDQERMLRDHVESALSGFKLEFEQLKMSVETMSEDPTICEKARRFFSSKTTLH